MRRLRESLAGLDQYWFGHGSPVALGVLRIAVGFLVLLNLLMLTTQFGDWFTEEGFVPQSVARAYFGNAGRDFELGGLVVRLPFEVPRLNILTGVTDPRVTGTVLGLTILAAVLTTLGLWTRISTIALAVGLVSLQHRNGLVLHGGDSVQRLLALYLAIAPCGKACSLDRLVGLWKGNILPGEPPAISLWPQRLIAYNVALIYFTTVWHKWTGTVWRAGLGTWYPARLNEFKRFHVPSFVNELPFSYISSYVTLLTELSLATLVFYKPFRKWVLLAGVLMHAGIEYSMNIPLFSFTMVSAYIVFYEGHEVSAWAKRLGERMRVAAVRVFLPVGARLRLGPSAALDAVDPFDLVSYEPGSESRWLAQDALGRSKRPFAASALRSVGAWVIAWVPGAWRRTVTSALEPSGAAAITDSATRQATARSAK